MIAQLPGVDWAVFGLVLALLMIFGIAYAALVHYMAQRGIDGQTAWMVVLGTAVTLLGASFLVGWLNALLVAACFAASGAPMVIEFVARVENARRSDAQAARDASKELLK